MIRTGDIVRHGPSGETWLVAGVLDDRIAWCGWPEGTALVADCTLIQACNDAEHIALVTELRKRPHQTETGGQSDRVSFARNHTCAVCPVWSPP